MQQPSSLLPALAVALLAAVGNGLFAYGQRRAEVVANPFLFILSALIVCAVAFGISMPFMPGVDGIAYLRRNWPWALVSGAGFYLTFLGFYFLYSRFGASHYAVSRRTLHTYHIRLGGDHPYARADGGFHLAAIACALLTVLLFSIGQSRM